MMRRLLVFTLVLGALGVPTTSHAWEAQTTHAGLTEQGALESRMHEYLRDHFGLVRGIFAKLQVPENDAPTLFNLLRRMSPTHGYIPDSKGRMSAISWLVAGSVVADIPAQNASQHFLDPRSGSGLSARNRNGLGERIRLIFLRMRHSDSLGPSSVSADKAWKRSEAPMGLDGFHKQFALAVSSELPAQRSRHLAGALLAAGSMLHILQDMGSPSHVRDDLAAHQAQIGHDLSDRGSRFEHIAALAFSRLGVPRASTVEGISSLEAHFHNSEGTGLADVTERNYFSANTMPRPTPLRRDQGLSVLKKNLQRTLRRPEPSANRGIDTIAARNPEGATYRSESGVCLARYRFRLARVTFWTDDDCALEQLEEILPRVGGYSASFLRTLFRRDLKLVLGDAGLRIEAGYGAGTWRVFFEGVDGKRREAHSFTIQKAGESVPPFSAPPGVTRVSVLFEGSDAQGNAIVATTSRSLK